MRAIAGGRLLLLASIAFAQNPAEFRVHTDLVTIPCTVVDSQGVGVTDLTREEFRVYDNGARRNIANFWMDADVPLTLGILIDASDSQSDQLAEHRETALALLDRILRPGDRAFVISVKQYIRVWADLSDSVGAIRRRLSADPAEALGSPCTPASACGGSPLWNAIYETARLKLAHTGGNKALLILTDGFDTGSTHTWRQAADEVERAEASLYAVQYQSDLGARFAPDLYRMLEESGGAWFGAPAGNYDTIVTRIQNDLRRRYVLGFRPDTLGGRLRHDVRVEVIRPGLIVRGRKAYFLPSDR